VLVLAVLAIAIVHFGVRVGPHVKIYELNVKFNSGVLLHLLGTLLLYFEGCFVLGFLRDERLSKSRFAGPAEAAALTRDEFVTLMNESLDELNAVSNAAFAADETARFDADNTGERLVEHASFDEAYRRFMDMHSNWQSIQPHIAMRVARTALLLKVQRYWEFLVPTIIGLYATTISFVGPLSRWLR